MEGNRPAILAELNEVRDNVEKHASDIYLSDDLVDMVKAG